LGSHYKWLRRNWSYRFRNSLIEFFDQENMGLDTKITLLWQLEPEILMKVRRTILIVWHCIAYIVLMCR